MERQRLSVQDAKSQEAASQKRLANSRAQARESYDSAISQAETAVERAGRELDRAEENLNRFYAGASADVTETARLEVPTQNAVVMSRLQKLLTREEMDALFHSEAVHVNSWNPNENERKQTYQIGRASCRERV